MATWKDYLKVFETKGKAAAWKFAQKHFPKDSFDYESARRFHAPTAKDRRESADRWKAINAVTEAECRLHCQFDGLPKLGKK